MTVKGGLALKFTSLPPGEGRPLRRLREAKTENRPSVFTMTGVDYFFFFRWMLSEASTSMKPSPATSAAWAMKTKAPGSMRFTRAFTL